MRGRIEASELAIGETPTALNVAGMAVVLGGTLLAPRLYASLSRRGVRA